MDGTQLDCDERDKIEIKKQKNNENCTKTVMNEIELKPVLTIQQWSDFLMIFRFVTCNFICLHYAMVSTNMKLS